MDSLSKKFKAIVYAAFISGVICAALRSLCLVLFYDGHIGYYAQDAILPVVSNVAFWIFAAAFVLIPFILPKKNGEVKHSQKVKYLSLIPAVAFIIPAIDAINSLGEKADLLTILSLLSALGSVAFFAMLAFSKEGSADVTVACGVCVIVYLALCWLRSYTDFLIPMNSPDKIFFNIACVGGALFIISELKSLCHTAKPRSYFCYISLAMISLFAYAIPYAVEIFANTAGTRASTVGETAVLLALLIYASARAFTASVSEAPEETQSAPEEE